MSNRLAINNLPQIRLAVIRDYPDYPNYLKQRIGVCAPPLYQTRHQTMLN